MRVPHKKNRKFWPRFATKTRRSYRGRLSFFEQLETRRLLTVTVNTFDDVVADDGFTSLREAIELSSGTPGEVVELPAGTYPLAYGELSITDAAPVTIQSIGGLAKIDAQGASRIFSIGPAADVTLVGLEIAGGYSAFDGGGVFNQGTVKILDSQFRGNASDASGGGFANYAQASVINTLFQDNLAGGFGGGLLNLGINGGSGDMAITDSKFIGNHSMANGGGLDNNGLMTITASYFEANEAIDGRGGAIGNGGRLGLEDSEIVANTARYQGGGIFNARVSELLTSTIDIAGTSITGNVSSEAWGGGFSSFGIATLRESWVLNNQAFRGGGGIDSYLGTLVVSATTIDGNSSLEGAGGGIHNYEATLEIHDSSVTNNSSNYEGGGIASYYRSATITDTNVDGNTSQSGTGGGIYRNGYNNGTLAIEGGSISGNTAYDSGGGIYIVDYSYSVTSIAGAAIEGNTSVSGFGGGVFSSGYGSSVSISGSSISANQGAGLALYSVENVQVLGNTISGNTGDGIQLQYGYLNTIGTPDSGNTITGNTGAGVAVLSGSSGNSIRGNVIHSNAGLAIDLNGDGRTPNDQGDFDYGPNDLQNYPVIDSFAAGSTTVVTGRLESTPSTLFTIDIYAQPTGGPVNPGSSARYLGSLEVTTDSDGHADFSVTLEAATSAGELVSATATNWYGSTSEFSDINLVRIVPLAGLATSENGATAVFQVALAFQPTSNVLIPLVTSDPSEGKIGQSSLTFTPANWNIPQVVNVTGVDDDLRDGPAEYFIETGPAISVDPRFNAFDPEDILLTNFDNDFSIFKSLSPAGALIYQTELESLISGPRHRESFSLLLDPGQTLSVLVEPSGELRPKVQVFDSKGKLIATKTASAAGDDALIGLLELPGKLASNGGKPDLYTIRVTGAGGTKGSFRVGAYLNSALEAENHGGRSNDSLSKAQSLTDAFIALDSKGNSANSPARAAVLGSVGRLLVGSNQSGQFLSVNPATGETTVLASNVNQGSGYTDLARNPVTGRLYGSGARGDSGLYIVDPSTGAGELIGQAARGVHSLVWSPDGNTLYGVAQGTFGTINPETAAFTAVVSLSDYVHGMAFQPGTGVLYALIGRYSPDLYSIDATTGASTFVADLTTGYGYQSLEFLADGRLLAGGDYALVEIDPVTGLETLIGPTNDGELAGLEMISNDAADSYSFELKNGDSAIVLLSGAGSNVELLDRRGTLLAAGVAEGAVSAGISDFIATQTGTYYVRVTRAALGNYSLVVTRNTAFGIEPNSEIATAQPLLGPEVGGRRWAMGSVGGRNVADVQSPAYVRSILGSPWNSASNETAMDQVFGTGNWLDLRFEFVDPSELFSNAHDFVFLEGGDYTSDELEFFLDANLSLIEAYVAGGNTLIVNAAPSEGDGMSFGFGGVELVYPNLSGEVFAADRDAPIFAGPFTPVTNQYFGNYFSHATVDGVGLEQLLLSTTNATVLAELSWGSGKVLFGGMTPTEYHSPQPDASNLLANIVTHAAGIGSTDFYSIYVEGNKKIEIETLLPAGGAGDFVNSLDPMLRLYDAAGNLVASNDNGAADRRNAKLSYKAPKNGRGVFYVEVLASPFSNALSRGEYFLSVKGASTPLVPFDAAAVSPADGERVRGPVSEVTIDFNDSILLTSLEPGDFSIDGVPASSVRMLDGNTAVIGIGRELSEGWHSVKIAKNRIQDIQGTHNRPFSSSFYNDITVPRVLATSIVPGASIPAWDQELRVSVTFSEPMNSFPAQYPYAAYLQGELSYSFYYPSDISFNGDGTVATLTFAGIPALEDNYTLILHSGDYGFQDAVGRDLDGEYFGDFPSGDGLEGGNFALEFSVDIDPREVPTPLVEVQPDGSLIKKTPFAASGFLGKGGDEDNWKIQLQGNQTLTVILTPGSFGLLGSIAVIAPDGTTVLGSAAGAYQGSPTLLQTVAVQEDGIYTIQIADANDFYGSYAFELLVNAAVEEETHSGSPNNELESSQSIEGSFIAVAGGQRGAVRGVAGNLDFYSFALEAGQSLQAGLYFDSPSSNYTAASTYDIYNANAVALGDINGDGVRDMVAVSSSSYAVYAWLGNGDGTFTSNSYVGYAPAPNDVELADLNADGKLDIVTSNLYNFGNMGVTVFLGAGDGTFDSGTGYLAAYAYNVAIAVGDVTGDGTPDLVTVDQWSNELSILPNNGDGTFGTRATYAINSYPRDVALADLDGINGLDVIIAHGAGLTVRLNSGDGTLLDGVQYAVGYDMAAVVAGDLDGDGDPDIVSLSANDANPVKVLFNNGGTPAGLTEYASGGIYGRSLALEDMDADGDLDLAVASEYAPTFHGGLVSLLANDGAGSFTLKESLSTSTYFLDVALADLNGDGQIDVVASTGGDVSVFLFQESFSTLKLYYEGAEVTSALGSPGDLSVLLSNFVAAYDGVYTLGVDTGDQPRGYSLLITRREEAPLASMSFVPMSPLSALWQGKSADRLNGVSAPQASENGNAFRSNDNTAKAPVSAPRTLVNQPVRENSVDRYLALPGSELARDQKERLLRDLALLSVSSEFRMPNAFWAIRRRGPVGIS